MAADEVPSLSKLQELAELLYTREYIAIKDTKFPSTSDRLQAFEYSKEAQDKAIKLLKMEESSTPPSTPEEKTATQEVWKYVYASLWGAFNAVRNMKLRADYINKIESNANEYLGKIKALKPEQLEQLTKDAIEARNLALEVTQAKLAKTSKYFSEMLKKVGPTYDKLVNNYSMKRFKKSFSSLETDEKMLVYSDIIEASGRSYTLVTKVAKMQGALGIAALFLLVGVTVWDIFTSHDAGLTAAKHTWVALGTRGVGFLTDTLVSTALNAGLVAVGATEGVAVAVAFIGGIAASFILVAVVAPLLGSLFDLMVKAFSLHIPPELKTSIVSVIKIPLGSTLSEELSTPL